MVHLGRLHAGSCAGQPTGLAGPHGCQGLLVAGRAADVRYVKFEILSNDNGADFRKLEVGNDSGLVGLSEVEFFRCVSDESPDKERRD